MSNSTRLDAMAGAAAGLLAGAVWVLAAISSRADGLLGVGLSGPTIVVHLLLSAPAGAPFGALFRVHPLGYAATISNGLLYGLLLWVAGPLTLTPLLMGDGPTWSAAEAGAAFATLIGHLLYGGITGVAYYAAVTLYRRRRPAPAEIAPEEPVTRVVVLGGGFGGVSAAQRLEQLFWRDPKVEITLASQSNYLLFTPMLAEVAASALEAQHISSPVRASLPHVSFHRCDVEAIDLDEQTVSFRVSAAAHVRTMRYDHLVLALGSVPNYFGLPGIEENAFALRTLEDATRLRNHVIAQLEQADVNPDVEERRRQLSFVVAGGGFAGTELIAELFDLVHSVLRYFPSIRRDELRFVLVHSRDRILPELGEELARYALEKLRARGIDFALNSRVTGSSPDGVLVNGDEEIPARTVVWTAGTQPNPILRTLPCERNQAGAVVAEGTLQLKGFANVWVVGDCGEIPDPDHEGGSYPPTAQYAIREGRAVARNIAAAIRGNPPRPFRFRTLGMLVPLGRRTGVAEIRGLRFSGLLAWLMWRGVYLFLLPGLEQKVRVLFDWTVDLFFPRDIVLTAITDTPTLSQIMKTSTESSPGPTDAREERTR